MGAIKDIAHRLTSNRTAMAMDLSEKVALVTGAAGGIGHECCKHLLGAGLKGVAVVDVVVEEEGLHTARQLEAEFGDGRAIFVRADVTKEAQMEEAFESTKRKFGRLDIVVNNAGMFKERDGCWKMELEVNTAAVHSTLLALQHLPRGGAVVNVASILGLRSMDVLPVYVASKHAVVAFTRSMGAKFHLERTGVRIMALCPGVTETNLSKNIGANLMCEDWTQYALDELSKLPAQGVSIVAKSLIHLLNVGTGGSVWVVEGGEPVYEVEEVHYSKLRAAADE